MEFIREQIVSGKTVLGIELGSTRIKSVLIDEEHRPIAIGNYAWENKLEKGIWTYSLEDVWKGIQGSFKKMILEVQKKYHVPVKKIRAIGISGMMHGYLVFDKKGSQLVPFRTWRNGITGAASEKLTELFNFNIPQRWSIAHLYQSILNEEEHIKNIAYMTTLSGYVHWKLTGQKVLGIGDASGMFPIDSEIKDYDPVMIKKFETIIADKGYSWKLHEILPTVLTAGKIAGVLTEEGANLLDPSGNLESGIPLCPPEGDAGTGMTATNSVEKRTGNVSAGTSVFAMVVLERKLKNVHTEIDLVTTPDGEPVAMVHANNCTSDLNAWIGLFREFAESIGIQIQNDELYSMMFRKAREGEVDCGGLLSYGYLSGENITDVPEGRPLFIRSSDSRFNLANFMRAHLYSALGALKIGMDILLEEEGIHVTKLMGHGGYFKTAGVGQEILASALHTPVSVMETAGEGGPWGMALLASYMAEKLEGENLETYLGQKIFTGNKGMCRYPEQQEVDGFNAFMKQYNQGIKIEQEAASYLQ